MYNSSDDRTMFRAFMVAVAVLLALYIVPVILFDFLGFGIPEVPDALQMLGEAVFQGFSLFGVPPISLLLGALSLGMMQREGRDRTLPRHIGFMMLFITLLSILIWIIDMSVY